MKMHTAPAARQRGFSILTGFILAIIMFGSLAFFLAGQGINTTFGATYSNSAKASALLTSAGYIKTGFDAVMLNGTAETAVKLDFSNNVGVFNPSAGGSAPQPLDPALFDVLPDTPATTLANATGVLGYWIFNKNNITLNSVGTVSPEYTILVAGLKTSICTEINKKLHGIITPLSLAANLAAIVTVPTTGNYITAPTIPVPASVATDTKAGALNGCYTTGDTVNVYIHTLLVQ